MKTIPLTAGLTNLFGPLDSNIKKRLHAVLTNPCTETWNDAHGIIIRGDIGLGLTLWQAILAVDPTFPPTGPSYRKTPRGKRVTTEDWKRIPDTVLIARALRYAQKLPEKDRKEVSR